MMMKQTAGKFHNRVLRLLTFGLVGIGAAAVTAHGGFIDFEDQKYKDGEKVDVITVDGVDVTFGTLTWKERIYIAELGGKQSDQFIPDKSEAADAAGKYFLTDEKGKKASSSYDYSLEFSQAVQNVTLDGYDFRADGGAKVGDTVTLSAYDELNRLIGTDVYTISGKEPDGNVVTFGIKASGIQRLELVHSGVDVGTGIDNLRFEVSVAAAPEPAEWAMIGIGAVVLGFWGFGRKEDPNMAES